MMNSWNRIWLCFKLKFLFGKSVLTLKWLSANFIKTLGIPCKYLDVSRIENIWKFLTLHLYYNTYNSSFTHVISWSDPSQNCFENSPLLKEEKRSIKENYS